VLLKPENEAPVWWKNIRNQKREKKDFLFLRRHFAGAGVCQA